MASSHFRAIPPSTATALSIALDPTSPLPFLSSPSLSTIVNLPPKRPIIWSPHPQAYARPGILRSDFLGTSHPRVLTALLVQVTGEEVEGEPCRRCRDDGGDWVGCVRPSRGEEGRTRGACANCWRDGKECELGSRRFESSTADNRSRGRNRMPSRVPKETPPGGQKMPFKPPMATAQTPSTLPPKPPTTHMTTKPVNKRAKKTAAAQAQVQQPTRLQQPVAAPQLHRPLAAPQAQQRHPASIPTIVITSPEPEPQPEAVQEMDTDLPEIEPLNQDELELFPGLIHPDARQNMSQEDSYCWHEINRQMDEPLMTNEELADLVDEFYG
ncbi:hypothetical protein ACJZ2D_001254 [Fusarium nematophilum]